MSFAFAGLVLPLAGCGEGEPIVVVVWPEMDGTFQYRSLMPVDASGLVCVEHGDIVIAHGGDDSFTASGDITMDCWLGSTKIDAPSGVLDFSNGTFGAETNKESWPMSWEGRQSWTYTGEAFWATPLHMVATGSGTGMVTLPDSSQAARDFTWTICRRFVYQNDAVERECDFS
jgi:hypothetical protein